MCLFGLLKYTQSDDKKKLIHARYSLNVSASPDIETTMHIAQALGHIKDYHIVYWKKVKLLAQLGNV